MIDATVRIVDRLIQLLSVQEKNREKYFHNFVEPLYVDAEVVVRDYVSLFKELVGRLENYDDVSEVIRWLEERRLDWLPLRIKLRSFLKRTSYNNMEHIEASMDTFQKGIWGLMKGGLSLVEEGHASLGEYGWHDHTVLDLLYLWSDQPLADNRERYVRNARAQLACVERAWQDVTDGYADLKSKLLRSR